MDCIHTDSGDLFVGRVKPAHHRTAGLFGLEPGDRECVHFTGRVKNMSWLIGLDACAALGIERAENPESEGLCLGKVVIRALTLLSTRQDTTISVGKRRSCESRGMKCAQLGSIPLSDKQGSAW